MSILGGNALGRFAIGQIGAQAATNFILAAISGSYVLTGNNALFKISEPVSAGAYSITGVSVTFNESEVVAAGAYGVTGTAIAFKLTESATAGAYVVSGVSTTFGAKEVVTAGAYGVTGSAAVLDVGEALAPGVFTVTGSSALAPLVWVVSAGAYAITSGSNALLWTGAGVDTSYTGGIGHYLYERERARQLAAITRKAPPPIDRRTAPRFAAIGSPPIAPPAAAANVPAMQNKLMADQLAASRKAKQRRDTEALLLLAS